MPLPAFRWALVTGSSGSYSLSGGYLAAATEYVGNSGSGAFTQSGGTNSASSGIVLGNNDGSSGSYNLSGGSLFAGYITDGNYASGTFTQTGGTTSVGGSIYVARTRPLPARTPSAAADTFFPPAPSTSA